MKKKIVLTGGHAATTALSVIEELVKRGKERDFWEIYWVGVRRAIEGKKVPTLEAAVFPKMGVSFHSLFTGRLQRKFSLWTIPSLARIPFGFLHAFFLLLKIRPKIIVSFGGFAAFPVVLSGWLLRIPVVIHEQTSVAGRANLFSSYFAKKIALAKAESLKFFPREKSIVTGNPVLAEIGQIPPKDELAKPATIYITGGSRGAQKINTLVAEIIEKLLKKFTVIHHTGFLDFEKFKALKKILDSNLRKNYQVYAQIDPRKIDGVYRQADIIVGRAGANTVSEIILTKRPAILIPLSFSFKDEQTKNAQFAQRQGIAKVLKQQGLTSGRLLKEILRVERDWEKIVKRVRNKKSPDREAASRMVDLIEELSLSGI